jgi:hypothetical protein
VSAIEPIGSDRIREIVPVPPAVRRPREEDEDRRRRDLPEQRKRPPKPPRPGADDGRAHVDVTV